jgi:DinB family protein
LISDFNFVIDIWIKELECYNFAQICSKPSPNSWSVGQLLMHLIIETNFYLKQIRICIATNENVDKEATINGKNILLRNSFPNEIIEGPPSNSLVPQPINKEKLFDSLMNLKDSFNQVNLKILKSSFHGKTQHPGLGYFNAKEWFQFSEMHLRHHLRQKERIDQFLKIANG